MSSILKPVGVIVGEASSSEFYFSSKPEDMPPRWEYLVTYSEESIGETVKQVSVVAQIERVISASQVLTRDTDFETIRKMIEAGLADRKTWGKARVLGFLTEDGELQQPKRAIMPGKPVYTAPPELLEKFYSYPKEEAICVGTLITRSEVPVSLSVKGFRRHLALIAQTGSGKTYLAGVLAEELLAKGGTIIMLDPHADYVFLSKNVEGKRYELSDRVTVFRNLASTGRYSAAEVGKIESYEVCFSDLSLDEVCLISGINERYANIINGLERAIGKVKSKKTVFLPKDILEELEDVASWKEEGVDGKTIAGAKSAQKYLKRLTRMQVFSNTSTNIDKMLKPRHLSVVDLSGLGDEVSDYIAYKILSDVYDKASSGDFEYPVFVFVEEAHRFVPPDERTLSSSAIKRIAAEGRKFGIFIVMISQRPSKLHPDALSQCNSQIVMRVTNPEDQEAIAKSSERLGRALLEDLPGLNTGEAVIVGEMTRAPIMARIRKRRTREGGSDIDIVGKLREASEKAKEENLDKESETLRRELDGFLKEG